MGWSETLFPEDAMGASSRHVCLFPVFLALVWAGCGASTSEKPVESRVVGTAAETKPAGLDKEAKEAIDKGLAFLHGNLDKDGSWGKHPGVTGIVLLAFLRSPRGYNDTDDPFVRRPLQYLRSLQKPDGAIYDKELANYSTSIALQALLATKNPKYQDAIRKARAYLIGSQLDKGEGYEESDPGYGGAGYGGSLRPDLSNTQMWADALKDAEESGLEKDSDAWKRMVVFVSRCQNRSESNPAKWAANDGGVVYSPWESKAGEVMLGDGRKGLRSYGAMTYAGLKSMIYAHVSKDDPRVQAAYSWIQKHYTVDENP
jgi:squalene-hopene/tetraprenyl-beta-curcumene cyclase